MRTAGERLEELPAVPSSTRRGEVDLKRRTEGEAAAYMAGFKAAADAIARALEQGTAPAQAVANALTIHEHALEAARRERFGTPRGSRAGFDRLERVGLDRS